MLVFQLKHSSRALHCKRETCFSADSDSKPHLLVIPQSKIKVYHNSYPVVKLSP